MQVLLPASVGEEMMRQDAPKNGAQLFEIASTSGATTHAGALLPYSCTILRPGHLLCTSKSCFKR